MCTSEAGFDASSVQMWKLPDSFEANAILPEPSGEYAGSASSVVGVDVRFCAVPPLDGIVYTSFPFVKAIDKPSSDHVGCVDPAPAPAPTACGAVPSAFATKIPFVASAYAIALPSGDHDGSVAPWITVVTPDPSALIVQMSEPQVNASLPLFPENVPPCPAAGGRSATASATSASDPFPRRPPGRVSPPDRAAPTPAGVEAARVGSPRRGA